MAKNPKEILTSERIQQIYSMLIQSKLTLSNIKLIRNNELVCLAILNEALTHTSSNSSLNHERLEFHGDAVLRLAATEYIQENFPKLKVGDRSALRAQLVSDEWLAKIGNQIGIKHAMQISPKALNDEAAADTISAEGTEALIGALYECIGEIQVIQDWLSPYWDEESQRVLDDPYKQNAKSALQEWCQGKGFNQPRYKIKEISKQHGDSKRFFCKVQVEDNIIAEGWGSSIKKAEKEAAKNALKNLKS